MDIDAKQVTTEIWYSSQEVPLLGQDEMTFIRHEAASNQRKRSRICTHKDIDDPLHEMFIIHEKGNYIPPHKHLNKPESFHLIQGAADIIIFDNEGSITDVVPMGEYLTGKKFYYRISDAVYHSMLIQSDYLVYHEVTTGPFRREDTVFAAWAPEEKDVKSTAEYMLQLDEKIKLKQATIL
jgi:cupin fold WbuC family metalloprotein